MTRPTQRPARPARPTRQARSAPAVPDEIRRLLGDAPLTQAEDPNAYRELEAGLVRAIEPADAIEWIWLKDLADLIWEVRRLRRVKVAVINLGRAQTADVAQATQISKLSDEELDKLFVATSIAALNEQGYDVIVKPSSASPILNSDYTATEINNHPLMEPATQAKNVELESEVYRSRLPDIERLDRLITISDVRRDNVLRDLYRRRETLARIRPATVTGPVLDAEFEP